MLAKFPTILKMIQCLRFSVSLFGTSNMILEKDQDREDASLKPDARGCEKVRSLSIEKLFTEDH